MDTPVLKPGGFWICPACGQRNKVWAPCSSCGTALAGMAHPEQRLASPALAGALPVYPARRRNGLLYALVAGAVAMAVVVAVVLSRLFGGAALTGEDDLSAAGPRAAATPPAPARMPEPYPSRPPAAEAPVPDLRPATPPAAVYTPNLPADPPGYSIPAPVRPPDRRRLVIDERRAGAEIRARQQAVRSAQDRFARAEDDLAAAEGGDPEREMEAMEQLDRAARALREAEAALDRARRRRAGDPER
jgi:hypothetical protein